MAKKRGIEALYIKLKECAEETAAIAIPELEKKISRKISSILHFTAQNSLKPSFDLLIRSKCDTIQCLINFAEKKFKSEVAMWVTTRLEILQEYFIREDKLVIYLCLQNYDELIKRMSIGLLYALRPEFPHHLLMMDDTLAVILNSVYGEAWQAMMRPYIVSLNYWPQTQDLLRYDPVILAPGSDYKGLYRLTTDKYVVMYRRQTWELSPEEVYNLAKRL